MIADNMSIQKLFSKLKLMEIFNSKINKMDQIFAIFQAKIANKMPTFGPFCHFLVENFH